MPKTEKGGLFFNFPEVEHPGTVESLIPIWGSGREALADLSDGDVEGAIANGLMAASDVFLAKAVLQAGAKGAFKAVPSSWKYAREKLGKTGYLKKGEHGHHWLIAQRDKVVPASVRNQTWNIKPMSPEMHGRMHGPYKGKPEFNVPQKLYYGTPTGAKAAVANVGGHTATGVKAQADRRR